jgi:hypothetical protein
VQTEARARDGSGHGLEVEAHERLVHRRSVDAELLLRTQLRLRRRLVDGCVGNRRQRARGRGRIVGAFRHAEEDDRSERHRHREREDAAVS